MLKSVNYSYVFILSFVCPLPPKWHIRKETPVGWCSLFVLKEPHAVKHQPIDVNIEIKTHRRCRRTSFPSVRDISISKHLPYQNKQPSTNCSGKYTGTTENHEITVVTEAVIFHNCREYCDLCQMPWFCRDFPCYCDLWLYTNIQGRRLRGTGGDGPHSKVELGRQRCLYPPQYFHKCHHKLFVEAFIFYAK